jgi:hemolysin activation/secretion protein
MPFFNLLMRRGAGRPRTGAVLLLVTVVVSLVSGPCFAQEPAVSGVQFAGLRNVREDVLRDTVKLKPGKSFSAAQMEEDRKALMALGFFRSVAAAQQTTNGQTGVTFRLAEWPRVAHIRVLGNTVVDRSSIHQVISTQLGQVLCSPQLQDDIRAIERLYRERGYVARISDRLLPEAARSGILRFEILEVQIEDVQIEGGSLGLRQRARRALTELPPQLYRPEAVTVDQRRLLKVRDVRNAVPRVETLEPGKVRIRWLLNPPPDTPGEPPSDGGPSS